ncbi:MAG TPA: metalloregulator ArsR/SmtB family transcription factor [bacterium]|uniref:HTH-type transcriptional repressor AseR n=1 Tax=candidate division TA06 bacterium ADurb.Bin417 TaxID=1852828 RepID=A0A1V5MK31_UNCT6|nr:MAG: HTH-type transcriptional repressor AseR [candidate division TA06 bacterium ADurb.Bin417]HNQ34631.1 metalloregulator ArsR/SmtB family transcription factor [bacterium]HNS48306.1 metalloregulator ArsR/SmtB family transcription factor [bacterium]
MKELEDFLRAVGDDKRLRILKMLERRRLCVCEITAVLGLRQPTVSRHLRRLEKVGLIEQEQNGYYRECRLVSGHPFHDLWMWLSERLEKSAEIRADARKLARVDRRRLACRGG